jgi:hypothetical protein
MTHKLCVLYWWECVQVTELHNLYWLDFTGTHDGISEGFLLRLVEGEQSMPLNDQLCLVAGSSCWVTKHCGSTVLDNLVALASYLVHIIPSVHMPFRAPWKGESWGDHISTFLFQHSPLNHNLKKKRFALKACLARNCYLYICMGILIILTCMYQRHRRKHTQRYISTG